jgi:hypothetical protein
VSATVSVRDRDLEAPDGVTVRACPDGPWLVRGADAVQTPDGAQHPTTRPVVAVCACDKSQRAPWCDGTHKLLRRD